MVQRWKCLCAYDGTAFAGWQSQAGGGAVQDAIEAALAKVFHAPVRIHGSGRTDAGAHARGQVFHFDATWRHGPAKLAAAARANLPPAVQLRSARPARPDFHARFSARGKIYRYEIRLGDADPFTRPFCWMLGRPLDFAAMEAAAARLRGRHDFRAFSARRGPGEEETVRHLRRLELIRRGRRLSVVAEADGFLYKMVRSLVGALVAVGEGRIAPAQITEMLQGRARTPRLEVAPARGLFLERVLY